MTAKILDGKQLANNFIEILTGKIQSHVKENQRAPGLAVILIGNDPASEIYVKNKKNACAKAGIVSKSYDLPEKTPEQELLSLIEQLNDDKDIDAILVQLPLPPHINSATVIERISPTKDVDGFHPFNLGQLAQGQAILRPCTPKGIMLLLNHYNISLSGLDTVIIGSSNIVGKPMALELINAKATVTICQSMSKELIKKTQQAELLITAAGSPHLIKMDWIKDNTIIIDVGINRLNNGKLIGDVDFENVKKKAQWITPVPGGIGPMTIASLLDNTYISYKNHLDLI